MTPQTAPTAPPPPPTGQPLPPPVPSQAAPEPTEPRRAWRDRLPEVVGAIGTALVLAAVVGFLSDTWEELDRIGRAIVLGGAAGGLTAAAAWLEQHRGARIRPLTSMLWVSGSATLGAAVVLAASVPLDGMARLTAALAGLAIAAHAGLALRRVPDSWLRQLGVVGGLLFAAGPFGTTVADRADWSTLADALLPFAGLLDPTLESELFLLTGAAHLAIGVVWLLWSLRTEGTTSRVAWVGSTLLLGYAALELYVLPWGVGALVALLVVLAYLVHGLVTERTGAVVAGTIGTLVAAGRVLWSLFSGEVAVTVGAFAVGLALLTWAVRARSERDDDEQAQAAPDAADAAVGQR